MITLGIPVLNNYDGLYLLLQDINNSTYKDIEKVIVINNGKERLVPDSHWYKLMIFESYFNLGVAGSWNKIISLSSGTRFIMNDDMRLEARALENMANKYDKAAVCYPVCTSQINSFSFYTITDEVINKVGLFDESISPNYAYFEDNDYHRRMTMVGVELKPLPCAEGEMIIHEGSKTLKNYSREERDSHDKKFRYAKEQYIKKWGGAPSQEKFETPYNL